MKVISGALFAGAIACGLVLHVQAAQASRERILYDFCSQQDCTDGFNPSSGLIEVRGMLYGTTNEGGAGTCYGTKPACGVVFALDPKTGSETVLHTFSNPDTDGIYPIGDLIDVKGMLYGATQRGGGGDDNGGTVFSLDPQTGAETLLHTFSGGSDGYIPAAGLINVKGTLYGTTESGGSGGGDTCSSYGCGTVFAVNRKTGTETVLHVFNAGADGAIPTASLIEVNGMLYGTTQRGGTGACFNGCGTVFAVNLKTSEEKVVYSFVGGNDGSEPWDSLINVKGLLYGTTSGGGAYQRGTVFVLDPQTGSETVLYSFCNTQNCTDGENPEASLIDNNGTLYGTTGGGGAGGGGTVFALDLNSDTEKVLYSFGSQVNFLDGQYPRYGLLAKGQWLYGTTYFGGTYSGLAFAVKR